MTVRITATNTALTSPSVMGLCVAPRPLRLPIWLALLAVSATSTRRTAADVSSDPAGERSNARLRGFCAAMLLLSSAPAVCAAANDFGVQGLIDMPSARMAPDGLLTATYARQDMVDIVSLGYQITPWLEGSFRYSIFDPRNDPADIQRGLDRSFELKARLWEEGALRPEVSVGVRDLLGTGVWEAEYVVATKQVGNAELTLGTGWGRLADRRAFGNPLGELDDRFDRRNDDSAEGGTFNVGNYFSGEDVGLFGGIRYRLPGRNAAVVAEYNSDRYRRERALDLIDSPSPFSLGLEWNWQDRVTFGASWQHGEQFALRASSSFGTRRMPRELAPNGFSLGSLTQPSMRIPLTNGDWFDRLGRAASASGLYLYAAEDLGDGRLNLVYANSDYTIETDALRRLLKLVEFYVPLRFETVLLTSRDEEFYTHALEYRRRDEAGFAEARFTDPVPLSAPQWEVESDNPSLSLSGNLGVRPYIFDPEAPFLYSLFARVSADVRFDHGLLLRASWIQNIHDTFDDIERRSDSLLPRVRSDIDQYLKRGETGIDRLILEKRGMLARDTHYHAFAGYLEEQYAGVGAEVLYRPFGSAFAVGANVIGVRQRDFRKTLSLRDYETVIGHVSAYWVSPFFDMDVAVHAGRYLARDWGATFEVNRRFANGWSVGAFATITDVPFREFGEGSFDKGLTLRIPISSVLEVNTGNSYRTTIRPVLRDGGARLPGYGTTIWGQLRGTHLDHLDEGRSRLWP